MLGQFLVQAEVRLLIRQTFLLAGEHVEFTAIFPHSATPTRIGNEPNPTNAAFLEVHCIWRMISSTCFFHPHFIVPIEARPFHPKHPSVSRTSPSFPFARKAGALMFCFSCLVCIGRTEWGMARRCGAVFSVHAPPCRRHHVGPYLLMVIVLEALAAGRFRER